MTSNFLSLSLTLLLLLLLLLIFSPGFLSETLPVRKIDWPDFDKLEISNSSGSSKIVTESFSSSCASFSFESSLLSCESEETSASM